MGDAWVVSLSAVLFLGASALTFVLGSSYYTLCRTNRSWAFRIGLAVAFVVAWLATRSALEPPFELLGFAFAAAGIANVAGATVGTWLGPALRLRDDSLKGIALSKALEAAAVVGAILLLLLAARIPLAVAYVKAGRLWLGLAIGGGGFVLFATLAVLQARSMGIRRATSLRLLPWILLFVFANAFMEELWLRALFLRPLVSIAGPVLGVLLTSVVFAGIHIGATYLSRGERLRFLAILFPLGLAWGASMHFTDSLIAASLFHAGADLMIVNGLVGSLSGGAPGPSKLDSEELDPGPKGGR